MVGINTNLHLRQINPKDPYFFEFNEIIKNPEIENKYFSKYLKEENPKLTSQYEQKSAFWVITYCNYILPKLEENASRRKDFNELLEILTIHSKIEEWILNNGILRAIHNEEERKETKNKVENVLKNINCRKNAVNFVKNYKEKQFFEKHKSECEFREVYYFFKESILKLIDESTIIIFLKSLKKNFDFDPDDYFYLNKTIRVISYFIADLKGKLQRDYFILKRDFSKTQIDNINKYTNWLYIDILLKDLRGYIEERNLSITKLLRIKSLLTKDSDLCKKLLQNSFRILSNLNKDIEIPFHFKNSNIEVLNNKLIEIHSEEVGELFAVHKAYEVKIIERQNSGFVVKHKDIYGFLPIQNVTDTELKKNKDEEIDWNTNVEITIHSKEFRFFSCRQFNCNSPSFFSSNNKEKAQAKKGEIIRGTVKGIQDYGVFVSTQYGDGLIHISEITPYALDAEFVNNLFPKGKELPVYVLSHIGKKLKLSLKKLRDDSKYQKIYDDIISFDSNEEEGDISNEKEIDYFTKIEFEKGAIFENYALIQSNVQNRIRYLKLAKIFFSNTNNARSYLLNIYIEYYQSLIKLDNLLADYSYVKYSNFKKDIIKIKEKVQSKTIEEFPEASNLLFFIDILYLFNSNSEEDIEPLFKLTKSSIEKGDILLKAIAKNALANNLVLTELGNNKKEEINSFTSKNLKRIRNYISQGELSVKETIEDKRERELKEERKYWMVRIKEDEGEKLEFKATFITPIPNNEKKHIIEEMKKQLKKAKKEEKRERILKRIKDIENKSKNKKGIEKIIIFSALKAICAFANTKGGTLLLGVSDNQEIFGLEQDYNYLHKNKNRDAFGKFFDDKLEEYFGQSFASSLLEKKFLKFPQGDVLIVKVKPSLKEIFILKNEKGEKEEHLYVRGLSSSRELMGLELAEFIKNKFRQQVNEVTN